MSFLKKSILYLIVPPVFVIIFSIWIGATIRTEGLTPDERSIVGIQQEPVPTDTEKKEAPYELKPIREIFAVKKQIELPPISEILPPPEKEEPQKEVKEVKPEPAKVSYNLMLILIMEDKKIAMINGKTLKEGETLADNTIVKTIEQEKVLLVNGGEEEWLFIR